MKEREKAHQTYLADGVYVELAYGSVRLFTSNGVVETNKIFMDQETLSAFLSWIKSRNL